MSYELKIWTILPAWYLIAEGFMLTCLLHTLCPPWEYDTAQKGMFPVFLPQILTRISPTSNHRIPLWSLQRANCLTLHFEGVFTYNTHWTRSGGWQWRQEEMLSLPGEYLWIPPTWMFNLLHINQSNTILLPMTYFNGSCMLVVEHMALNMTLVLLHVGWHNSAASVSHLPLSPDC